MTDEQDNKPPQPTSEANGNLGGPAIEQKVSEIREARDEAAAAEKAATTINPREAQKKIEALLDAQTGIIVGTLIRGLMVSSPGMPAHLVLESVARQTGRFCAMALQADISTMAGLRKGYKEAFDDGIKLVPIIGSEIVKPKGG